MKIPVEVFVPKTTPEFMRKNIESQGAKLTVAGEAKIFLFFFFFSFFSSSSVFIVSNFMKNKLNK